MDYLVGEGLSLAIIYLIPVAFTAWFGGRRSGVAISLASAAIWLVANYQQGLFHGPFFVKLWNGGTSLAFFIVVSLLIVKLRQMLDNERVMSRTDFLTGAVNSRAFAEIAEAEIRRMRRYEHPLTIAYFDLDNFKQVNDQFGHSVGNELLRVVVATILGTLRNTDVVARLGGDEFALLLPETDYAAAQVVITKVKEQLQSAMAERRWPVTFSFGALTCALPPRSSDEMIALADKLMLAAKQEKNTIRHSIYTG
jgi:diguanylate cyclase (GGDEF)-like protein